MRNAKLSPFMPVEMCCPMQCLEYLWGTIVQLIVMCIVFLVTMAQRGCPNCSCCPCLCLDFQERSVVSAVFFLPSQLFLENVKATFAAAEFLQPGELLRNNCERYQQVQGRLSRDEMCN